MTTKHAHAGNLTKTQTRHKEMYINVQREKASKNKRMTRNVGKGGKIKIKMDKNTLIKACINSVAVNGRPFEMIEEEGFQMIVDPIIKAIDKNAAQENEIIETLLRSQRRNQSYS